MQLRRSIVFFCASISACESPSHRRVTERDACIVTQAHVLLAAAPKHHTLANTIEAAAVLGELAKALGRYGTPVPGGISISNVPRSYNTQ